MVIFNRTWLFSSRTAKQIMFTNSARNLSGEIISLPSNPPSFQTRAKTTVFSFFTIFVLLLLFLVIVRWCQQVIFINHVVALNLIQNNDLQRMLSMGLRFDRRTVSICLLPAFLLGMLLSIRGVPHKLWLWMTTFCVFAAALVIAVLAISNIYYIQTYRTYFEIFVFSFLHESSGAVMTTI